MPVILLLVFIIVPIAEIGVFIHAGEHFGLWPTIGMVILTAILGTIMLRYQGLRTLARVQKSLEQSQMPVGELFTGLCLLVAGTLLLTPGFLTDAAGFTLFIPGVRTILARVVQRRLSHRNPSGIKAECQRPPNGRQVDDGPIIDAVFTEIHEQPTNSSSISSQKHKDGETE